MRHPGRRRPTSAPKSWRLRVGTLIAVTLLASSYVTPEPASAQRSERVRVVSLGDSYIAGNGAGSYFGPRGCYRSRDSFGQRWANLLAAEGVDVRHHNGACSGARTRHIESQIASSSAELASATHVLVTIGGNDAGFGDLVFQCLVQRDRSECRDAVDDANALLPAIEERLIRVLEQVGAAAPDAVVVLVGYPLLVGSDTYRLPGYEAGNAIRTLGALADGTFLRAVRARNLAEPGRYVHVGLHDTYSGHELGGSDDDWIRNIGTSFIRAEWIHPNDNGHRATARLLAGLDDLRVAAPAPSPGNLLGTPGSTTSLLVGADGLLRHVATPADVECLVAAGARMVERSDVVVRSLPQRRDEVARCDGSGTSAVDAADLDGDGRGDLVVAAPLESVGDVDRGGALTAVPGGRSLVDLGRSRQLVARDLEADALFGRARALGDFDGDGRVDLAIGAPGARAGSFRVPSGAVTVVPGAGSADTRSWTVIDQATRGIDENAEVGDDFGQALASGDLDGDGFDDLVVGIPGEGLSGRSRVGAVVVIPGSGAGLATDRAVTLHQQAGEVPGSNETGDRWGEALAVGDVNGDGFDDLAVGAPGEGIGAAGATGSVTLLYGSPDGLRGATALHQNSPGVPGNNTAGDGWGSALAMGDLDADGFAEVIVGAPAKSVGGRARVGATWVFAGSIRGLVAEGSVQLRQGAGGVPDASESEDRWGAALAVGDIDGDGAADLAIGAPGESIGTLASVGAVTVLRWSAGPADARMWHQDSAGVPGVGEVGDSWGSSLALVDLDGDGHGDLSVGAPGQGIGGVEAAGAVTVLPGSPAGIGAARSRVVHQNLVGVPDASEPGERWGLVGPAAE